MAKRRIGEILIEAGLITKEQLEISLRKQKEDGGKLGEKLVELGYVTDSELAEGLAKSLGIPFVNLRERELKREIINLIPQDLATQYRVVPIERKGRKGLIVAVSEPTNIEATDNIRFRTGLDIITYFSPASQIREALVKYYHIDDIVPPEATENIDGSADIKTSIVTSVSTKTEQSSAKLVNSIIIDGFVSGADIIHITPFENWISLKYRIDGTIFERKSPPIKMKSSIFSYIATLANFDRKNKSIPQSRHLTMQLSDKNVRMEIKSFPTSFGEKITIRIFRSFQANNKIERIGISKRAFKELYRSLYNRYGIIALAGPKNSEKTNTFYTFMAHYAEKGYNVVTAEHPIQAFLPSVTQVGIDVSRKLLFSKVLKSFINEDADVFGITDITEERSFPLAIHVANNALLYCLVDAKDSFTTIKDMVNYAPDAETLALSLNIIISKRLLRRICPHCKGKAEISERDLMRLGLDPQKLSKNTFYKGTGCKKCNNSGYLGQIAVFEVLRISKKLKNMIAEGSLMRDIRAQAKKEGFRTLKEEGLLKFVNGLTTFEEVFREFYN